MGGVAFFPLLLRGAAFLSLLLWVGLLLLSLFGLVFWVVLFLPCLPLGGAAWGVLVFLPLFWRELPFFTCSCCVVLPSFSSSFGWCCFASSFFGW